MATTQIHPARVRRLNDWATGGSGPVLYWMQRSQRAECNHALEYAIQRANDARRPLLAVFGLTSDYPGANLRHYAFLLEGLAETAKALARRGIRLVVHKGDPAQVALRAARGASLVVCDRGYLRHERRWRRTVARGAKCEVVQVEGDVVVPVEEASDKAEIGARTLRPRLHRRLAEFLEELATTPLERDSLDRPGDVDLDDLDAVLSGLRIDRSVPPSPRFRGGTTRARSLLRGFLDERLSRYERSRSQTHTEGTSQLSPYLHFGQISPVQVALEVRSARARTTPAIESYLEELIVRRELACNFVQHTPHYDSYRCLPAWARETLSAHRDDERPHRYTARQLQDGETHDPYWNAATREMTATGYMHNYMRMYWGKKILEWCNTPEYAYRVALRLNNRYFLDGRDPASFANVAWIFGLHDRPWPERPVFGKVRSMTAGGLERKGDPEAYVQKVEALVAEAGG